MFSLTRDLKALSAFEAPDKCLEKRPFPSKLFDRFSKQELQGFLEILHYSLQAQSDEDIEHVLLRMKTVLPFKHVIAGLVRLDRSGSFREFANVLNVSYPNDWLSTYAKNGYARVDPVLLCLLGSFRTQVWAHTYEHVDSYNQNAFIEEAKSFGLGNGITVGALETKPALASFFSFAGNQPKENERYAGVIEYLVHHLHHAFVKNAPPPPPDPAGLSPRELTVLSWMKMGKTNWEIARILGVSERTVRFHVGRIFVKLDVTSRAQAVALAMETGLLAGVCDAGT